MLSRVAQRASLAMRRLPCLLSSPAYLVVRQFAALDNEATNECHPVDGCRRLRRTTLVAAALAVRQRHGDSKPDLGSISGSWLTEHRATHDGKS